MSEPKTDFVRRHHVDTDELLGARWWNESFHAFHAGGLLERRKLLNAVPWLVLGGIGASVVSVAILGAPSNDDHSDDDSDITLEALDLQRREGWSVAASAQALASFGINVDVDASPGWRLKLGDLARLLAPDELWRGFAVPTLFQALAEPANASLREAMHPYVSQDAPAAFERGQAMRALVEQPDAPTDLALLVDLPGPLSVAFAAALAPRFCPVFTFDNWPHPLGVVPSHFTLGACLYYLPRFETAARTRVHPAPAVFVLDANRLAPYGDNASQFDNRYVARVPSAAALKSYGVKRILYVRPDAGSLRELDDLNADFVAWQAEGIAVRAVALSDFAPSDLTAPGDAGAPRVSAAPLTSFYYGGHPYYQHLFWSSYGYGVGRVPRPTRFVVSPPPARLSGATDYRPTFRPTIFATRPVGGLDGIGKQKPSGFGRVSVRMGSNGRLTSLGSARGGSFGRSRSSYSG